MSPKQRHIITVGTDEPVDVELEYSAEDGCWWAEIEGQRMALNLRAVEPDGKVSAEVDGESMEVQIVEDGHGYRLRIDDAHPTQAIPVRARTAGDIVLAAPRSGGPAQPAPEPVVASPITGEVLSVLVSEGVAVSQGEPMVLVEAMKMETTVKAPRDAVVTRVHVAKGDRVKTGTSLVELG